MTLPKDVETEPYRFNLFSLLRHFGHDAVARDRIEAGRIDHEIVARADATEAVLAIARQAGLIGDQCVATARETVEEGRLADVGTADKDDGRFHDWLLTSAQRT